MPDVHAGERVDGGEYVDVGGDLIWHFHDGDPQAVPTVLLHGAFASASTWGAQIAEFITSGLRLYVPERIGHGHTPDVARPYTMAGALDHMVGYLESVVAAPAHLIGWADGGVLALLIARARPDLVNRMVVVGNYVDAHGRESDEFLHRVRGADPEIIEFLRTDYDAMSPDGPAHFRVVYDKIVRMLEAEPNFDVEQFATVEAPTLVVAPDRGVVLLEHALALSRALPHGRFAVLPGTHILPVEAPELFNPLVLSYLAAEPPARWEVAPI